MWSLKDKTEGKPLQVRGQDVCNGCRGVASCNNCLSYSKHFAPDRGRSCITSCEAARERNRKRRARLANAATPGLTGHSSAARPAAALAAEAAPAAAQMPGHGQATPDSTGVFQRACAKSKAAATPAHSAEHHEITPVRTPAESARDLSIAAASRSHSRMAADDVTDTSGSTSGSPYAPSTADGAPAPGGAASTGPHAGGASNVVPCGAAGPQGMGGGSLPWSLLPERAGPLRALTNVEGHAAGALCLTWMLARRWHGVAQPRRHARA